MLQLTWKRDAQIGSDTVELRCYCRHDTSRLYAECDATSTLLEKENLFSPNGKFSLNMGCWGANLGNLILYQLNERYVVYQHSTPLHQMEIWSTVADLIAKDKSDLHYTYGRYDHIYTADIKKFVLQRDHNMCVYSGNTCQWASQNGYEHQVQSVGGYVYLHLHDDGNLVLYDRHHNRLWGTR